MNWDEFNYEIVGNEIRYEKQLDMLRNVMFSIFKAAGGKIKPHQIFHLPFIDDLDKPKSAFRKLDKETEQRLIKYFN